MGPDNTTALGRGSFLQTIERAVDPSTATIQYVRVDHRRLDILGLIRGGVAHDA